MTYGTLIQTVTVGAGGAATMSFSAIPATFTDLMLVVCARDDGGTSGNIYARFNGDSGNNYTSKILYGNGSSAGSTSGISNGAYVAKASGATNTFGSGMAIIPNYAGSTSKSISTDAVDEANATAANISVIAYNWSGTAAISSITMYTFSGNNFSQYSTASLYGLTHF
jgi:hypothetical protein